MISTLLSWCTLHPYITGLCIFIIMWIVDDKMPEDKAEYKLLSKFFKKLGFLMTEEIREEQKEIKQMIGELKKDVIDVDDNRKKDSKASMKHQITQLYHFYQDMGYILEKDKESYNDLYERYTANGGNSYVHDDINPFMNSLPRFISHRDAEAFYIEHHNYNNGTENK